MITTNMKMLHTDFRNKRKWQEIWDLKPNKLCYSLKYRRVAPRFQKNKMGGNSFIQTPNRTYKPDILTSANNTKELFKNTKSNNILKT